ncbi:MAG: hypothetical protein ABI904_21715 [Chloroflexota bacterium]
MKRYLFGLLALMLLGCASQTSPQADSAKSNSASLPDLGSAPELTNDTWLNVDAPLRLADLRGKVVLIDMWTFG